MADAGTNEGEDAADFQKMFLGRFAANKADLDNRIKKEREASKTPKQRARKAVRVAQINFRASKETKALLQTLSVDMDCSAADVLEVALQELAKRRGAKNAKAANNDS